MSENLSNHIVGNLRGGREAKGLRDDYRECEMKTWHFIRLMIGGKNYARKKWKIDVSATDEIDGTSGDIFCWL